MGIRVHFYDLGEQNFFRIILDCPIFRITTCIASSGKNNSGTNVKDSTGYGDAFGVIEFNFFTSNFNIDKYTNSYIKGTNVSRSLLVTVLPEYKKLRAFRC